MMYHEFLGPDVEVRCDRKYAADNLDENGPKAHSMLYFDAIQIADNLVKLTNFENRRYIFEPQELQSLPPQDQ